MRRMVITIIGLALLISCSGEVAREISREVRPNGWPTQSWPTASPASQGMDEAVLSALDADIAAGKHGYVDGMLVIRNGNIIYENSYTQDYDTPFREVDQPPGMYNYYDPDWHPYYQRGPLHTMQSVSKSVTSALIGIAIRRGELPGVDVEILPYFDGMEIQNLDDRKRAMTLRDLLTMRAGLEWDESTVPYTDLMNSCARMEQSEDWIQFVMDRPMAEDPGTVFEYNSGVTVLLAHILWKATGMQADDYAAEHLFEPLGISEYYWKRTPTGIPDTEGGLYLTAPDLAKIGYLYLKDGIWEDQRILPPGWVAASLTPVTGPAEGSLKYGYQWWLHPYEGGFGFYAYSALGYGGQRLFVVPEFNLVAVFTGWNIYETPGLDGRFALNELVRSVVREDVLAEVAP